MTTDILYITFDTSFIIVMIYRMQIKNKSIIIFFNLTVVVTLSTWFSIYINFMCSMYSFASYRSLQW